MTEPDEKRLFFGLEAHAPWPDALPKARLLDPEHRHLTFAFLGSTSWPKLQTILPNLPRPAFRFGPVGIFDQCLFLPKRHPRVAAWHVEPFGEKDPLADYHENLLAFLEEQGYSFEHRNFLKHVTLGRSPFSSNEWEESFHPLPVYFENLHLYESNGNLKYTPIWTHRLPPPFKEIEHEADVAFHIYGATLSDLNLHAQIALSFECPDLVPFLSPQSNPKTLEEIMIGLNEIVTRADREIGTPFKAVSFHGEIEEEEEGTLKWEMIVDV